MCVCVCKSSCKSSNYIYIYIYIYIYYTIYIYIYVCVCVCVFAFVWVCKSYTKVFVSPLDGPQCMHRADEYILFLVDQHRCVHVYMSIKISLVISSYFSSNANHIFFFIFKRVVGTHLFALS